MEPEIQLFKAKRGGPAGLAVYGCFPAEHLAMIFELVRERAKRRCAQIKRVYSVKRLSGPVARSLSGSDA